MGPYHHILAPTDFSEPAARAVDAALDLAVTFGAHVTIVHTFEIPIYAYTDMAYAPVDLITPVEDAARQLLDAALVSARKKVPEATAQLRSGVPWEQILAVAEEVRADLIVMGTHGRTGLKRALIGSVTERVVRHSPIPVLTIRVAPR